ncbi:hypothetical protein OPT61_g6577 [Boeremia exigua]|uniref:Uncharacterized protein n=1 Tax=Boeremia exigua TaxID=749465 RepID=A0ACC2I5K2_9PLEO|nr:hypothetical protein OPT61_g6577 [Boeremia exigua]
MDVTQQWFFKEPSDLQKSRKELYGIFRRAVDLAELLRTQKAYWSIRYPTRQYSSVPKWPDPAAIAVQEVNISTCIAGHCAWQKIGEIESKLLSLITIGAKSIDDPTVIRVVISPNIFDITITAVELSEKSNADWLIKFATDTALESSSVAT